MAGLILIVRSVRAATFNDYIHMHQLLYMKSQITLSAHDEMNKMTLPSKANIGSVIMLINQYDSVLSNRTCTMLDFQIH